MENSFFEFRRSAGRNSYPSDGSLNASDEAIDDSMRSNESYSRLLLSVPTSARKAPLTVADSDDGEDDLGASRDVSKHKFSLLSTDSPDSSFIGHKKGKRGVPLIDSGSDTDDMTPDEDMVMSAATRMSILGYKPKDMLTDESDYIESDDAKSRPSSQASSLSDFPTVDLSQCSDAKRTSLVDSTHRSRPSNRNSSTSRRNSLIHSRDSSTSRNNSPSCRNSSNQNYTGVKSECDASLVTNSANRQSFMKSFKDSLEVKEEDTHDLTIVGDQHNVVELTSDEEECHEIKSTASSLSLPDVDLTQYVDDERKSFRDVSNDAPAVKAEKRMSIPNNFVKVEPPDRKNGFEPSKCKEEDCIESDVQIVEQDVDLVALISDEDSDVEMMSVTRPPAREDSKGGIRPYLVPKSYPNANVVYVPRHVKLNETNKLEGLREDLHKLKYLLENMAMEGLPDGGARLRQRLAALEGEVRAQAEKVAAMVEEPAKPTAKDVARDGFNAGPDGLSWDDLQAASNRVQPKMLGKQALSTHIAERGHILERLRDLHESLASRPPETEREPQPRALRSTLMPHQTHALAWLRWRETQRPRGGLLADDMGLGKTLTMISLVVADKEGSLEDDEENERWNSKENSKLVRGGTLVVCPASLLQQWAGEVVRHCKPHFLSVCQHHGAARTTQPYKLGGYDMVFTTYNIVSRDLDKMGVLMKVRWSRVILDEAHIVRNHKALTSRAVSALHAARRWCLTGTPVHNKELDIFALLKFLRCTPFDDIQMWKKWIDNKSAGGQERLATVMRTLLLRRTKVQLQESGALTCLPERSTHSLALTLSKEEMNVYQKVLVFSKTLFAQFLHQRAERQDMSGGFLARPKNDDAYSKMHKRMVALHGAKPVKAHEILVLLLRLRQLCCHAGLISAMLDPDADERGAEDPAGIDLLSELNKLSIESDELKEEEGDGEQGEEAEVEATTVAEAIRSVLSPNNPVFDLERTSSKISAVLKCLQENVFSNPKEKAVVVSQWTSVLALVGRELRAAGAACATLSGAVPVPARAALVDKFNDPNSDVKVLLLSLCAGGVGLNLCGANHLLLLDPHWNPQLEEQAQDRIYRVGQTKPVHIYKFMCKETVEQSIKLLQEHKLELARNVLTGARHSNSSKLSIEDLKILFNMNQ